MKIFIMAIMLGQLDITTGYLYYTPFEENPIRQFKTINECLAASQIRGDNMYKSSLKYPELGIVEIKIDCIEKFDKEGTI